MFDEPSAKRVKRSALFSTSSSEGEEESARPDGQLQQSQETKRDDDNNDDDVMRIDYGFEYEFIDHTTRVTKEQFDDTTNPRSKSQSTITDHRNDRQVSTDNKDHHEDDNDDKDENNKTRNQEQEHTTQEETYQFRLFKPSTSQTKHAKPNTSESVDSNKNNELTSTSDPTENKRGLITLSPTPPPELTSGLSLTKREGRILKSRPLSHYFTSSVSEARVLELREEYADVAVTGQDVSSRRFYGRNENMDVDGHDNTPQSSSTPHPNSNPQTQSPLYENQSIPSSMSTSIRYKTWPGLRLPWRVIDIDPKNLTIVRPSITLASISTTESTSNPTSNSTPSSSTHKNTNADSNTSSNSNTNSTPQLQPQSQSHIQPHSKQSQSQKQNNRPKPSKKRRIILRQRQAARTKSLTGPTVEELKIKEAEEKERRTRRNREKKVKRKEREKRKKRVETNEVEGDGGGSENGAQIGSVVAIAGEEEVGNSV